MKALIAMLVVMWAADAQADAMLVGNETLFPTKIDVDVTVRAQVESTTIRYEFPPVTSSGNYSLTVPSPVGGAPIGVDVDRGAGLVPLPVVAAAPAAPNGGSSDPELAAWSGTAPLVAELLELEPGSLVVRVRFVRLLRRVGGDVAFEVGARRCPARAALDPGAQIKMLVRIETARDLTLFDATGGTGTTLQPGVRRGALETVATQLAGDEIVKVKYREQASGIHAQLLAHRTPASDPLGGTAGYFLLLVDADTQPSNIPRTISLVVDHSGSMAGEKIVQAREAARAMLDFLKPDDEFAIHIFDDDTASFRSSPVIASDANISAAREWIKDIVDDSGTNLDAGVRVGLQAPPRDDRFDALVLLSDGLANIGETDKRRILQNARNQAAGETRIFTFSVGTDADFPLMEALARSTRGRHVDLNNVQATADLVTRVRELFEDIHDVRLLDVELAVANVGVADVLPEAAPDLFSGGQVVIAGRYETPGIAEVRVAGFEGATPFELAIQADAPALIETDEIIKYVWATEKVRALMAQIADGVPESEIRPQVEEIGVAYRIQTPYTRYSGTGEPGIGGGDTGCTATHGASAWLLLLALFVVTRRRASSRSR